MASVTFASLACQEERLAEAKRSILVCSSDFKDDWLVVRF